MIRVDCASGQIVFDGERKRQPLMGFSAIAFFGC